MNKAVAATSVGVVNGNMLRDLCYEKDSWAEVDFNVVMTEKTSLWKSRELPRGKRSPKKLLIHHFPWLRKE